MDTPALRAWLPLVAAVTLNAAANVLLKLGANREQLAVATTSAVDKGLAFFNAITLVAIVLFGVNVLFYRKALNGLPLSVAYPVMLSGSLLLATVAARLLPSMNERLSGVQLTGMGVIIVGVIMVTRGAG
jgi:multidrug transporter EmrE-like cation transporter